MRTKLFRGWRFFLLLVIVGLASLRDAEAVDIMVTNNADSGAGTLRQAIQSNASLGGGNRILFSSNLTGPITLTTGEILMDRAVTIAGPTAVGITVSGNNSSRVFHLTGGSAVNISSLTIANGNSGGQGAGIYNDFGCTLVLSNCTLSANVTGNNGGGIANNGSVTADNCTFSGNSAASTGGGIYNYAGPVVLRNCTVVSNSAGFFQGGGICNYSLVAGTSNYLRSTIVAGNSSGDHADVIGVITSGGYNLIGRIDYSTPATGGNADGVPTSGVTNGVNHDLVGTVSGPMNAMIGALQNNGGPTFTHALKPGSPAVDHGKSSGLTADQRGAPRPYDFAPVPNSGGGDGSDIGAFEISPPLDADFTGGRTWTALGPFPIPNGQTIVREDPVSGRVSTIAVHPTNPNIVYVGTAQGGMYRTLNGGTDWTQLMDTAFSGVIGTPLAIGAIAIDPTNPSNVLVGTGEGNLASDTFFGTGFYIITNSGGITPVVNGPYNLASDNSDIFTGRSIDSIAIDPANRNNVFCATASGSGGIVNASYPVLPARGLYRCTNAFAGINATGTPVWTRLNVNAGEINTITTSVVIDPSNANNLVCALYGQSGSAGGIYRSTNALAATPTFILTRSFANFINVKLAINKVGSVVTVYATTGENAPSSTAQGKLYKSVDGGASWGAALGAADGFAGAEGFFTIALGLDPANANKVYIGGVSSSTFKYSTNGGTNFTGSVTGLHSSAHAIAVSASSPSVIYHGNDGGIWKSIDSGLNWTSLNNTSFSATLFQSLALHPTDRNFSIGGAGRNGTVFLRPDGTWTQTDYGEGGSSLIDQSATNTTNVTMYHTYFNQQNSFMGTARLLTTLCATNKDWAFRGGGGGSDPTPVCDGSATVVQNGISVSDPVNFYAPQTLGPGNPNRWYFGTDKLYRSINRADTATVVSQVLQTGVPISAIAISLQDDNVRLAGLNNGKVFATFNGSSILIQIAGAGSTVGTTTTPATGLGRILVDPNNKAVAYVAFCGFGTPALPLAHVWKTTNLNTLPGGPVTFIPMANGLPDIPANALAIDPLTGSTSKNSTDIYVGTDAGVYYSADGGANWAVYGNGLPHCAVFGLEIQNPYRVIRAATHGRGLYETLTAFQIKFTKVTRLDNGHIRLQGVGAPNQIYTLQSSPSLSSSSFSPLASVPTDSTGAFDYDATPVDPNQRFYRLSYP